MIGIYCRRSNKEVEKQVSIEVQKEKGVAFANKQGIEYRIYTDIGITGTKDEIEDRPQFAEMLRDIDRNALTAVWVLEQSRLERNPRIWQLFQYLIVKKEIKFYPNGVETDLNDPQTRLVTGILSLTNEMYAKLTGLKVKASHLKNVTNGKGVGLSAYGYKKDDKGFLVIDEIESEIVKKIFELSLAGNGSYTIATILNSENIPTKYNSFEGSINKRDSYTGNVRSFAKKEVKWRGNVIYDMLTNTIYKGQKKWNDGFVKAPIIIDESLWDKVFANLQVNKKNVGKKEQYNYLLNGIIFCENCSFPMHGKKRLKGKDSAYKCNHTDKKSMGCRGISIAKLETFIIRHLFQSKELKKLLLEQPESKANVSIFKTKLRDANKNLERIEGRITKAYKLLLDPDFEDDEEAKSQLKAYKKEKENLISVIGDLETKVIEMEASSRKQRVSKLFDAYHLDSDFATTKRLVHSLVERIGVYHGKDVADKGYFLFDLKYKGYDEKSIFATNYKANKFLWLTRHRTEPTNDEDKQDDRDFIDGIMNYYKIDGKPNYVPITTTQKMHGAIIINQDELIEFG